MYNITTNLKCRGCHKDLPNKVFDPETQRATWFGIYNGWELLMEHLVILVFKIPRAEKSKAQILNDYMSKEFANLEGYAVRVIVLPTSEKDPFVECIYPQDPLPDENIIKLLNNIQKEIDTWEEKH